MSWTILAIYGTFTHSTLDRFWESQPPEVVACVTDEVEVKLTIGPSCDVKAVTGGPACLRPLLVGASLPASYCGCGMAFAEQRLTPTGR